MAARPTTRKARSERQKERYLAGEARHPYRHTPTLRLSLSEDTGNGSDTGMCAQCRPILSRHAETFKAMLQQGSQLKRCQKVNPHPKKPDTAHYRDVKRQNEWLRENVFDSMGNYLYYCSCIRAALHVSKQRIAHQRRIKQQKSKHPIVSMAKADIERENLGEFVIMPSGIETSFKAWWRSLASTVSVDVRYPHERHGNAGRPSNSTKSSVKAEFLAFVDANSQPNGRSQDSSGPTYYFLPKFSTIQSPKPGSPNYEQRRARSLVGEFNRAQREAGKEGCSNGSSHNWLKMERPKHAICPHQEDYCDFCAKAKAKIKSTQTTLNRLRQNAASTPEEIKQLEEEIKACQLQHERHREEANKSHDYFVEVSEKCATDWKRILELQSKPNLDLDETEELSALRLRFTLVVCVDYQMSKLLPSWGESAQPGSTYYLQKLSHDLFGLVNHATNSSVVYIFDERVGPKTDHTLSYITHYIQTKLPSWVRRIHIFMDNTVSTNKNSYTMGWAAEMVQQKLLDFVRVSFMIAGHTKFSPDKLFSKIALTFNRSDVFTTDDLSEVVTHYGEAIVDDGQIVVNWREPLSLKYSKLAGIRSWHDFVFTKNTVTGSVVVRVRNLCYTGAFQNSSTHIIAGQSAEVSAIPEPESSSYFALKKLRSLSEVKVSHLRQMFDHFIPSERRLPFL